MNSLKTIYSRVTTLESVEKILDSVGISIKQIGKNGEEDVRPVSDIFADLAGKWDDLSSSQRQNIAVQVAGRNHLTRFLAYMNNFETSIKATEVAYNSQGSAMRENEKYLESFEARINKLKTGFTELSIAMGEAFLSDGILVAVEALKSLATIATTVISKVGALPVILGTAGLAVSRFSMFKGLRDNIAGAMDAFGKFSSSVRDNGWKSSIDKASTAMNTLDRNTQVATGSARAFGIALKGAMASTLIGGAFVVLGIALEKIIGSMAESKRKSEELEKANEALLTSYHEHGNSYEELIKKYDTLNKKFETNKDSMSDKELSDYTSATNELANALPNAIKYVDANGDAHLKSTEAIKEEAKYVKELSEAEAKVTVTEQTKNIEKRTKAHEKEIDKLKELKAEKARLKEEEETGMILNPTTGYVKVDPSLVNHSTEIAKLDAEIVKIMDSMSKANQKTIGIVQDQSRAYLESKGILKDLSDAQLKVVENYSQQNHALLESTESIKNEEDRMKAYNKVQKELVEGGNKLGEVFSETFQNLSKGLEDDPKKVQDLKKSLDSLAGALPDDFLVIDGKVNKSFEDVEKNLRDVLSVTEDIKGGETNVDGLIAKLEKTGMGSDKAKGYVALLGKELGNQAIQAKIADENLDEYADALEETTDKALQAIDPISQLFGTTSEQVSGMQSHIQTLQLLKGEYKNYEELEGWKTALADLSLGLGISESEIAKNLDKYGLLVDAMSKVQVKTDDLGKATLDYGNMSKEQKEKLQDLIDEMGGTATFLEVLQGKEKEATEKTKENTEKTKENTESKKENKKASEEQATATEALKGKYETLKGSMNEVNKSAYISTVSEQLGQFQDKIKVTQDKAGNFKLAMTDGSNSEFLNNLKTQLDELGLKLNVTKDESGDLKLSLNDGTGSTVISNIKANADDAGLGLDSIIEKANILKENTNILPNDYSQIDFVSLSTGLDTAFGKVQLLSEGLQGTAENIITASSKVDEFAQKVSNVANASDTIINNTNSFDTVIGKVNDLTTAIFKAQEKLGGIFNGINISDSSSKVISAVNSSIGSIGKKADGTKDKVEKLGQSLSGLAGLTTGGLGEYNKQISSLSNKLASATKNGKNTANAQKDIISSFKNVTKTVSSYNSALSSAGGKVGNSFEKMSKSVASAVKSIISAYNKNVNGLADMVKSTKNNLDKMHSHYTNASKKSVSAITSMTKKMHTAFKNGIKDIVTTASQVPKQIGDGITKHMTDATSSMDALAKDMVKRFKEELGIHSPSRVFTKLGGHVVEGLVNGLSGGNLKSLGQEVFDDFGGGVFDSLEMIKAYVSGDFSKIAGSAGAGVQQWAGVATKALMMTGQYSESNLKRLLMQMDTESSGNMKSINLWDSNAKRGTPSKGLMQVIDPTFRSYAMPGYNKNIYDPLSNILASIRYAMARYGSLAKAYQGHGYANGGFIDEEELAWHGEEGEEVIIPLIKKRRKRALELWAETGERLGILGNPKGSNGGMAFGGASQAGALSGDGGGNTGGGDSGSSGTLISPKPSPMILSGGYNLDGQYEVMALATSTKKKTTTTSKSRTTSNKKTTTTKKVNPKEGRADAFTFDKLEREANAVEAYISRIETKMNDLNKGTLKYRDTLKSIIAQQNKLMKIQQKDLDKTEKRQETLKKLIKNLGPVKDQTTKEREKYNQYMQEYDSNISKIQNLKASLTSEAIEIKNKTLEIFTDFIDNIASNYDKAISTIQGKIDKIDFDIEKLNYTNPDDKKSLINAYIKKDTELQKELALSEEKVNKLQKQYDKVKKPGKNDKDEVYAKEKLDEAKKEYQEYTLAILANEKQVEDTRASIADEAISTLKDYYGKMKDMAVQAIDLEIKAMQEAHDKKVKIWDEEIAKINSVYDATIKGLDAQKEADDYEAKLSEQTNSKAQLVNKIALLSRDTSKEGRKKVADLQAELATLNSEIEATQKEHQDKMLRDSLEANKQAQIDAIEAEKEKAELVLKYGDDMLDDGVGGTTALEAKREEVSKYYEDIINDDAKWARLRNEAISGSFDNINAELGKMKTTLDNMNKGVYTGLYNGFVNLSDEVKKQIEELNALVVDNLLFNSIEAISDSKEAGKANDFDVTPKKTPAVTTPTKTTTEKKTNTPAKVGLTAPDMDKPDFNKVSSGTSSTKFTKTLKKGSSGSEVKALQKVLGVKQDGIFGTDTYNALIKYQKKNGLNADGIAGKATLTKMGLYGSSSSSSSSSSSANRKVTSAVNFRSTPSYSGKVISTLPKDAKVQYLGMESGWAKIKYNGKTGYVGSSYLKAFKTGGYTGDNVPKDGALAILHNKELVLNERQTSDILDTAKIMDRVKNIIPNIKRNSLATKLSTEGGMNVTTNNTYELTVNIDRLDGSDKEGAKSVAKEIMNGLKKLGKK